MAASNGNNFVFECIASSDFADYLSDNDTDAENSTLPATRRWAWYCKLPACPEYYKAWVSKSNFSLHLYESEAHRRDPAAATRKGRRELTAAWKEETAFDMSEPKKRAPEGVNRGENV
ncbi:hypothetical protein F5Y12DRAFT_719595 [Xylaria sp. FL1777]|nr:hypothetical protein F5Y12DRAFT_719595 [Xylaria sp. FL1777]